MKHDNCALMCESMDIFILYDTQTCCMRGSAKWQPLMAPGKTVDEGQEAMKRKAQPRRVSEGIAGTWNVVCSRCDEMVVSR